MIEVEYLVTTDVMTDEEFMNQEERKFIITDKMIMDLIEEHGDIRRGRNSSERESVEQFYVGNHKYDKSKEEEE